MLVNNRQQTVQPFVMRCGYTLPSSKPIINARSKAASTKSMFKDDMKRHRCPILATNYYEWEHRGDKVVKYAICPEHSRTLYLADIYHLEKHEDIIVLTFTILTREASPGISFIHDQMSVILPPNKVCDWLNVRNDAKGVIQAAMLDVEHYTFA